MIMSLHEIWTSYSPILGFSHSLFSTTVLFKNRSHVPLFPFPIEVASLLPRRPTSATSARGGAPPRGVVAARGLNARPQAAQVGGGHLLGPLVEPFYQLFWGRVPLLKDYRKKGTLILTSLLEDLVWVPWSFEGPEVGLGGSQKETTYLRCGWKGKLEGNHSIAIEYPPPG